MMSLLLHVRLTDSKYCVQITAGVPKLSLPLPVFDYEGNMSNGRTED